MIYTSYFARMRYLVDSGLTPIAICAKAPAWYSVLQYKKLAPKYGFFMQYKQDHDADHYTKCFYEQVLAPLDAKRVYEELRSLAGNDNFVLLCFEKPGDFCHRHIVADWLNAAGIEIKEWQP